MQKLQCEVVFVWSGNLLKRHVSTTKVLQSFPLTLPPRCRTNHLGYKCANAHINFACSISVRRRVFSRCHVLICIIYTPPVFHIFNPCPFCRQLGDNTRRSSGRSWHQSAAVSSPAATWSSAGSSPRGSPTTTRTLCGSAPPSSGRSARFRSLLRPHTW